MDTEKPPAGCRPCSIYSEAPWPLRVLRSSPVGPVRVFAHFELSRTGSPSPPFLPGMPPAARRALRRVRARESVPGDRAGGAGGVAAVDRSGGGVPGERLSIRG